MTTHLNTKARRLKTACITTACLIAGLVASGVTFALAPFDETGQNCQYRYDYVWENGYYRPIREFLGCTQEPLSSIERDEERYESDDPSYPPGGGPGPGPILAARSGPATMDAMAMRSSNNSMAAAYTGQLAMNTMGPVQPCMRLPVPGRLKTFNRYKTWGYWQERSNWGDQPRPPERYGRRNIRHERGFWMWEDLAVYISGTITISVCYRGNEVLWGDEMTTWHATWPWSKRAPEGETKGMAVAGDIPPAVDYRVRATAHFEKCPVDTSGVTAGVQKIGVSGGLFWSNLCVDGLDAAIDITITGDGDIKRDL